ncbi:MAG: serine hydrolase [Bacteroidota bacterium]
MKYLGVIFLGFLQFGFCQSPKKIAKYIEQARKDWDVPGMSVGIVKDGEVFLSQGFGTKRIDNLEKVDGSTAFAIASNTKAFVSSCLARLVEEGKIEWEYKVQDYLPYFSLFGDPYASSNTTIKDLLCHRVGLGTFSGDVIWYKSDKNPESILKHAASVPKAFDFRAGYGYSNLMFIAAGEVIRKVTDKPWEEVAKEYFIQPLEMENTVFSVANLPENAATPHKPTLDDGTIPIKWANWDNSSAAGGIISSANDMCKWMIMQLSGGTFRDETFLSRSQQNILWTPHNNFTVSESSKELIPGRHFSGYGLGWSLMDYHGNMVVSHGGGYDGMYSRVMMIPDLQLGIVVLTNSMEGISTPLAYYIANQFMKEDQRDWSAEFLERSRSGNRHREDVQSRIESRKLNTSPVTKSANLAGSYFDKMYGSIEIKEIDNKLKISFSDAPSLDAELIHWHYDTYEIKWSEEHAWFDFGTVRFVTDNNLKVIGLEFDVPNGDIFFDELHPKKINAGK